MWIVFGTDQKTQRVPGGARVDRRCESCGETATFYEKEITATFQLYFINLFDYRRHRVMSCGCCGACYATDELGAPARREDDIDSIGEGIERAARRAGGYLERAADVVESGISSLLSSGERARIAERRVIDEEERREEDDDDPLADPLEKRFRELEKKRIKID
jgi:hypothetical protein